MTRRTPRTARRSVRGLAVLVLTGLGLLTGCASVPGAAKDPLQSVEGRLVLRGHGRLGEAELLGHLREELAGFRASVLEGAGLTRSDVDDLAYALELHYRDRGFPEAYVDYRFDPSAGPQAPIELRIEEGPRVRVRTVELRGRERLALTQAELEALVFPGPSSLFGERERWYVAADLRRARARLEALYLERGFQEVELLEPEVVPVEVEGGETRLVDVRIEVREGPRLRFESFEVRVDSGALPLSDAERRSLASLHRDADGRPIPFTPRAPHALRARLVEILGVRGHPDADVEIEPRVDPSTERVHVVFVVHPGPRITIGEVELRGNVKTRSAFVRRRVTLRPGDRYDLQEVRRSFRRLFATGLFQRVHLYLEPMAEPAPGEPGVAERRLVVELVEGPSLEFYLEPGLGSYEGLRLKAGALDRNLLGTGRSLRGEVTLSTKYQRLLLGVSDRALFESDVSGSTSAFYSHREEPSFTHQELGGGVDLAHDWPTLGLEALLGYRYRQTEVVDVEVQSPELSEFLTNIDISSASLVLVRDTRDHLFLPTAGARTQLELEVSDDTLGSEVNFLSAEVSHAWFTKLPWEEAVLGVGLDLGVTAPVDGQRVLPLQVRRFNGGATSVRSFDQDELGPLDSNGEPLGGEGSSVVSLELRQGLLGNLSGALFYDAGHLTPRYEEVLEFNGMRQAVGLGLRYLLPIGPARMDLGVNPDPGDEDEDWVLHFAVGLAF